MIAGITGPAADAAQIASVKTMLLDEIAGVCTTLYNGARLAASGDAQAGFRTVQVSLVPLALNT